jgi:ABC-type transporter Mla MlaB component
MLSIKKTGEGYYLVSLTGHNDNLGKSECLLIKKEIMAVLKPHREITINIKGVKNIENGGLNILHELKNVADGSKCKLRFINAELSVINKIAAFTEKKVENQKQHSIN